MAAKVCDLDKIPNGHLMFPYLENEILMTISFQKENVQNLLKCYDYYKQSNRVTSMYQYCNRGDLSKIVAAKNNRRLTPTEAINFMSQILKGFFHLQTRKNKIVHRDIKLENIFVHDDLALVGDFGLAAANDFQMYGSDAGNEITKAPEVFYTKVEPTCFYTSKCDIWSLGIVFYQLVYGYDSMETKKAVKMLRDLPQGLKFPSPPTRTKVVREIEILIKKMIVVDPASRIDWPELFSHPFFCIQYPILEVSQQDPNMQTKDYLNITETISRSTHFTSGKSVTVGTELVCQMMTPEAVDKTYIDSKVELLSADQKNGTGDISETHSNQKKAPQGSPPELKVEKTLPQERLNQEIFSRCYHESQAQDFVFETGLQIMESCKLNAKNPSSSLDGLFISGVFLLKKSFLMAVKIAKSLEDKELDTDLLQLQDDSTTFHGFQSMQTIDQSQLSSFDQFEDLCQSPRFKYFLAQTKEKIEEFSSIFEETEKTIRDYRWKAASQKNQKACEVWKDHMLKTCRKRVLEEYPTKEKVTKATEGVNSSLNLILTNYLIEIKTEISGFKGHPISTLLHRIARSIDYKKQLPFYSEKGLPFSWAVLEKNVRKGSMVEASELIRSLHQ